MKRSGPYIFLLVLIGILLFIAGLRHGTNVERENKAITFYLSMAPTKVPDTTPTPNDMPEVELINLNKNTCGAQFVYPSTMTQTKTATGEAHIESARHIIRMSCTIDSPLFDSARDITLAQEDVVVNGKKLKARVQALGIGKAYSFVLTNPYTGKPVAFLVDSGLMPLFGKTLEFTR